MNGLLPKRWLSAAALAAVVLAPTHADDRLEYAVKATYIYKFAPFVTWPSASPQEHGSAFNLCVNGADNVTALLPEAVKGQTVNGRPVVIRHVPEDGPIDGCNILYVAESQNASQLLNAARGKPILTVTEDDLSPDGIIHFKVVQHHVRFDIDERLATDSGLSISSKLLGLAHAVQQGPKEQQ